MASAGPSGIDSISKFPRTKHLFAVGKGVSRDDLLMDKGEENLFYTDPKTPDSRVVSIEEKIDGANLGISIAKDYRLLCQNRSHYVTSVTHKQFSPLDSWVQDHSAELFEILEPERHILFGEWVYAKHSIHYNQLPSYFIAFDLYDRKERRFYSRRERNKVLNQTTIPCVPLIQEQPLANQKDILNLLKAQQSQYYPGPIEGVYLRIDEDSPFSNPAKILKLKDSGIHFNSLRGKVVREEFLTGIEEQWTRQAFTKNVVRF
ncbi:DNA ligase III [Oopsacas minuta]|uniref:DNA ligase III n=1 Tax=Oopsacas minuta TaxID=111878 RepID=A0AAV7K739_9METZ|nr:DNA ligase III [Oopsacas minuta]